MTRNLSSAAPVVLVAVALLAGASRPADAQITAGANTTVINLGIVLLGNDIAYDPAHNVYLSVIAYGGVYGVFVAPSSGGAASSPFPIGSANATSFGHYPKVVFSQDLNGGTGGFLVAWHQNGQLHSIVIAYPTGVISAEQIVSDGSQGGTRAGGSIGLAYSPASRRFLATWTTAVFGVQGRFLDAAGVPSGSVIQYADAGGAQEPQLAWNSVTNEFGLIHGGFNSTSAWVTFRRVPATGAAPSAPLSFGYAAGTFSPSIAVNTATHHYILGWSLGGGANGTEFDQNGVQVAAVRFLASRLGTPTSFEVAYNPVSNTFLAASEDPKSIEVAGVELNADGSASGIAIGLSSGATTGSFVPRVAARTNAKEWSISYSRNMNALANQIVTTGSSGGASSGGGTSSGGTTTTCLSSAGISPNAATVSGAGGTGSISVVALTGCAWTAQSLSSGASITGGATGSGSGTVSYAVSRNPGAPRQLTLRIAEKSFTITQGAIDRSGGAQFGGGGGGDALLYNASSGAWLLEASTSTGFSPLASGGWGLGWTILPADFNGDGLSDLFFNRPSTGDWVKFTNTGNGQFSVKNGVWATGWQATIVDFNGDGRDDVFLYNPSSGAWFKGITNGNNDFDFIAAGTWRQGWSVYPADFDGDGRGDLFIYNNTPGDSMNGYWYQVFTRPDQTFAYSGGTQFWGADLQIMPADLNADGLTDLFMYRTSTGDFYRVVFGSSGPVIDAVRWNTGWTVRKGDFNGDRRDDVFVYNRTTGAWWMIINASDGTYRYFGGGWGPGWDVLVSEFNGDGVADLLLYNSGAGVLAQAITVGPGSFDVKWVSVGSGFTLIGSRMSVF